MFKRVVQAILAVLLLAVLTLPNSTSNITAPALIAGDDPGGGTGGG
jgi:hypothetical protein